MITQEPELREERPTPAPATEPATPAPGFYPVPAHGHHHPVVEREWDGEVWLERTREAPEGTKLAKWHRRPWRFLRRPGWILLLVFLVATGIASALWSQDSGRERIEGIQIAMPVFAAIATLAAVLGLLSLVRNRIRFDRVGPLRPIVLWGVLSGVIGVGCGLFGELGVPELLGSDPSDAGWNLITGPAEEGGKMLLPIILWFSGRFRSPSQGLLLVLVSGATFGVIESAEYALSPVDWEPTRPFAEIMHPLFTGFAAAVAWRAAYARRSWFTAAGVGAWLLAMALHSANDAAALDPTDLKFVGLVTPAALLVAYLLLKHNARQLVPPDNVEHVSKRWRPVAPRHAG